MRLVDYIEGLTKLISENPDSADYMVVTASDGEGNEYTPVYYAPSIGNYSDGEFMDGEYPLNAVCVN